MLDPRLYRVAFVPVLLALMVAAFSLQDRPRPIGTTLAPDAFDGVRAATTLDDLASAFPRRRPGDAADDRLAHQIAQQLRQLVPGTVEEHRFRGETIDGTRDLVDVVATRPGAPGPPLVVVAHRDAAGREARAELSSTAALLELAGIAGDGRLRRTITFISAAGGSGGFAGAREEAKRLGVRADAILVLGDLAGAQARRPFVVPFSNDRGQAPLRLRRTVEAAARAEIGTDPGGARALTQWIRYAVPVTVSEQGPFLAADQPAVLLSASGERPPAANTLLRQGRLQRFGRAALRALYALDNGPDIASAPSSDLVVRGKVLPSWAVRLLVGTLLLPPLLVSVDAFARLRRRRDHVGSWAIWALSAAVPFALTCAFGVALAAVGLIAVAPPAPIPGLALEIDGGAIAAFVALLLVFALGWVLLRPALLRLLGAGGRPDTPGAAIAVVLVACGAGVALWVLNPYAAALVVPALHIWLWALAPGLRLPRAVSVGAVVAALAPLVLVAVIDARAFGLDAAQAVWFWALLVAGGHIPGLSWLAWSLVWGCAVAAVLVALRRAPEEQGPQDVTVRGPVSYAGPGSLGGTQSALRR